ncbi:MAG: low molecular weight phosphatase family protein [Acidimicrobiaceae bacterium]|nr:low molecular weight phosphatase family protein [Acidimicrobiaceae bacterium]MYD05517.1 low molecular weight phosphatase family protein [Acidimicrobiaceae bacterium]MYI59558.1 low molecular weight phosphatase family protein [Acidimicrobiaceae bacterium]
MSADERRTAPLILLNRSLMSDDRPRTIRDAPRPQTLRERPTVTFLCTGNAARSVMGAAMMRAHYGEDPPVCVLSGGTHVLPGQPMSVRTRTALERHGLRDPWHRSHQLSSQDVARSALIVAMEPDHLFWMRRTHPEGAGKTGSLKRVARDLTPGSAGDLAVRVAQLGLAEVELEAWEEVVDPGAGQQADYDAAADEVAALVDQLIERLV